MRNFFGWALFGPRLEFLIALGLAFFSAGNLRGQSDSRELVPNQAPTRTSTDVVFLVRAPSNQNIESLQEALTDAARFDFDPEKEARKFAFEAENLLVRELNTRNYASILKYIAGDVNRSSNVLFDGTILNDGNMWQVIMPATNALDTADNIESIEVRYKTDGISTTEKYLMSNRTSSDPFTYFDVNTAILDLPTNQVPFEYRLNYTSGLGKNLPFKPWPSNEPEKYFFVKIPEFNGGVAGRVQFFNVIGDGRLGSTIIAYPANEDVVLMSHVKIGAEGEEIERFTFLDGKLVVLFKKLDGVKETPTRVWVLFPLTSEQRITVESEWKKLKTLEQKSAYIRSGQYPMIGQEVINEDIVLKVPAWHEIKFDAVSGEYKREQKISFRDWPTGEIFRFVVYEQDTSLEGNIEHRVVQNTGEVFPVMNWPQKFEAQDKEHLNEDK